MAYVPADYASRFSHEWNMAVWKLLQSGYDLSQILIVPKIGEEPKEMTEDADEEGH
jgi:hypothetical protein